MKNLLVICLIVCLVGCASFGKKVPITTTEFVDKPIPIYIVPAPPVVPKPTLATDKLTPEQQKDLGEMVKAFGIDRLLLMTYSDALNKVVEEYRLLAKTSGGDYEIVMVNGEPVLRKKADVAPPAPPAK